MEEKNESKLNVTEEKMKKKFKSFQVLTEVIEIFVIVALVILLVVSISDGRTSLNNFVEKFLENTEAITNKEVANGLVGNLELWIKFILLMVVYISGIIILRNLRKIFEEIATTVRPFSEKIIKRMEIISIMVWIIYAIESSLLGAGLIIALAVTAMVYIFKYGYKLQVESDETL